MRIFPILFFLLYVAPLSAQSDFLKDPDIVWAAELEQDWIVDVTSLEAEWDSGITTLKLLRTSKNEAYWSSAYLADLVFQAAMNGQLPVFKDPLCQQALAIENIYPGKDTIVTFDPETYEEKKAIVWVEPMPLYEFKAWRLRQVLAYHRKDARWSTTVEAIAPLFTVKNSNGDSIGLRPLFWFRPDNKRQNLHSNHVVWAKQVVNRGPRTQLILDDLKLVKVTDGFQRPMEHQIRTLGNNFKIPFYGHDNEPLLTDKQRQEMISRTDTVVTFDPETYEETIQVVHNELNASQVRKLRLIQNWYWDERKHQLSICLNVAGALIDVLGNDGNYRYTMPLFYRRAKGK
ncbi:MAG: hypothetical protein JNM22_14955 [Saprospiraceae bacterium]|nr:hypothetical protein [Saprospiraceae bacterium]